MTLNREGAYIYVGTYGLGREVVGLLASNDTGGHFCIGDTTVKPWHSKVKNIPYLTIGMNQSRWDEVLEVLLHETYEYLYYTLGLRYNRSGAWSLSHANYTFVMNHEEFAEAIARSAKFLAKAQVDLCRVYKQMKK